jgi:hypothetical protein
MIQAQHNTTTRFFLAVFTARTNHITELHGAATHASTRESSDFEKAHRRLKPIEVQSEQFGRENPWASALTRGEVSRGKMRQRIEWRPALAGAATKKKHRGGPYRDNEPVEAKTESGGAHLC